MESTTQEPIIFNMETDSNLNTIRPRGRPKKTEQEKAKPKKTNDINEEQQQFFNIQSKLNVLKETEDKHHEALKHFKEAEQTRHEALNNFKEAEREYNKELKQFKPKPRTTATKKKNTKKETENDNYILKV